MMRRKKLLVTVLILSFLLVGMGCSSTKQKNDLEERNNLKGVTDKKIFQDSQEIEKTFEEKNDVNINIVRKMDSFLLYPEGFDESQAFTMLIPSNWEEESEFEVPEYEESPKKLSKEQEENFKRAKEVAVNYINESDVIKDKESCRKFVEDTKILNVKFTDEEYCNMAMVTCNNTIYLNENLQEYFCEYMYLHELIHVISNFTNAGTKYEFSSYRASKINEATTDLIALELAKENEIKVEYGSDYGAYYEYAYYLIAKYDFLQTYFYSDGYDSMIRKLGKDKLDVYFLMVNYIEDTQDIICYIINELYK